MAKSTIEHFRALQKARAAGDEEAAQVIAKKMVDDMNTAERTMFGAASGVANVVQNVGNILGLVEDETVRETRALTQPLRETTAGRVGEFGGELLTSIVPAAGVVRGVSTAARLAPSLARTSALTRGVATGATEGAVQGAVTAGPDERGESAYLGALTGGAFPLVGAAYRSARSGVRPTRSARELARQGVELTPGQMNPQGALGQLEEVSESLPLGVGTAITKARQGGWRQARKLVAQESAPPGFARAIPDDPNRAVEVIRNAYSDAYKIVEGFPVAPKIMSEGADIPLSTAFRNAVRDRSALVKDDDVRSVSKFLKNQLSGVQGRPIKSEDLLSIRSDIRELLRARDLTTGSERLLLNAEKAVTDALESQLPEDAMKALKGIDNQYAKFAVFRRAVVKGGDQGFTPNQLSTAVKESADAGEYAAGGGLLRQFSAPSAEVFAATQPRTGRMLATLGALGLGGYSVSQDPSLGSAAPLVAAGLLYGTSAGRRAALGQTGLQRNLRQLERTARREIPKAYRQAAASGIRRTGAYTVPGLLVDEEDMYE